MSDGMSDARSSYLCHGCYFQKCCRPAAFDIHVITIHLWYLKTTLETMLESVLMFIFL